MDYARVVVLGWPQTLTGAAMLTLEEARRLFRSIRTFYIIILRRPPGLAQVEDAGTKHILVWSSRRKAKDFAISEGLVRKNYVIESCDYELLRDFALKVKRNSVVLDYSSKDTGPWPGLYLTDRSVN